jgi:hypothetical protein
LTEHEIGLLRAWIDQGAEWPEPESGGPVWEVSPAIRYVHLDGDEGRFREHWGYGEGWGAGLEGFAIEETMPDGRRLVLEGRLMVPDEEYRVAMTLERPGSGFLRAGMEQHREYYDDSGGYYEPFGDGPFLHLDRNLHLDVGRLWMEIGIDRPQAPRMVLGYEFQYRTGTKSTLQRGGVNSAGVNRSIAPAFKDINEETHRVTFDFVHETGSWRIEDNAVIEFHDQRTRREFSNWSAGAEDPFSTTEYREHYEHVEGANALRLEKRIREGWMVSAGQLYTRHDGEGDFGGATFLTGGGVFQGDVSDHIRLEREAVVFNLNTLAGPWRDVSLSAGVQNEWLRQEGLSRVELETATPATFESDLDKVSLEENVELQYSGIPATVLYAEGRFQQESVGQFEEGTEGGGSAFERDTDGSSQLEKYRVGFSVSPWRQVSLNAHVQRRDRVSDYDHPTDLLAGGAAGNGYPGFIRARRIETDELEVRLVARPATWFKTTLKYQLRATDYRTETDAAMNPAPVPPAVASPGGGIRAANHDAHRYSLNATFTPWSRLYLSSTLTYEETRTEAAANGNAALAPYRGEVAGVLSGGTWLLSKQVDLHAWYSFSRADYRQRNTVAGLPLGVRYELHGMRVGTTWRISENTSTRLEYGWFDFDDAGTGGVNDYTAHVIFAVFAMRLP